MEAVQRCKSAFGLWKGGKVEPEYRVRRTEDREQRGSGDREVGRRTDATQSRPYEAGGGFSLP